MRIKVLLFANLAEAVGADRMDLELSGTATVAAALDSLSRQHPAIATMRPTLATAVDERYASAHTQLREGCTLALIPPVSGG